MDVPNTNSGYFEAVIAGLATVGILYIHGILSEFKELIKGQNSVKEEIGKSNVEIVNLKDRVSRLEKK